MGGGGWTSASRDRWPRRGHARSHLLYIYSAFFFFVVGGGRGFLSRRSIVYPLTGSVFGITGSSTWFTPGRLCTQAAGIFLLLKNSIENIYCYFFLVCVCVCVRCVRCVEGKGQVFFFFRGGGVLLSFVILNFKFSVGIMNLHTSTRDWLRIKKKIYL